MEPEGVVDVLRRLCKAVIPGGLVLDLQSVPPSPVIEADGEVLGEIDYTEWFERAARDADALDQLVREGLLVAEAEIAHDIWVVYAHASDLLEHAAGWKELKRLPDQLRERVEALGSGCVQREHCLARRLRRPD